MIWNHLHDIVKGKARHRIIGWGAAIYVKSHWTYTYIFICAQNRFSVMPVVVSQEGNWVLEWADWWGFELSEYSVCILICTENCVCGFQIQRHLYWGHLVKSVTKCLRPGFRLQHWMINSAGKRLGTPVVTFFFPDFDFDWRKDKIHRALCAWGKIPLNTTLLSSLNCCTQLLSFTHGIAAWSPSSARLSSL